MALPFYSPGYNSLLTSAGGGSTIPVAPLPGLGGGPVSGATAAATDPSFADSLGGAMFKMAPWLALSGAVTGAIGSYFQVKSKQNELKSQALSLEYQKTISDINARQAESQAQTIMLAGERQIGAYTMKAGLQRGAAKASMAARGGVLSEGSNLETMTTHDLMKEVDTLTINANTVRAAAAARTQGTNYENQGLLQGVSAENLRGSAATMSPGMAGFSSLLGSATTVSSALYQRKLAADLGYID